MFLRTNLPEPVYVAVVTSITGLLPSKLIGVLIVLAQAAYVSYRLGDPAVAAATVLTGAAAIPRIVFLALWTRRRQSVTDARTAARWEGLLAAANLPTAFGIGLIAAATIVRGDAEWSMVEIAVAVGFVSTYVAAPGVRPAVGTAHFLAVMGPSVAACVWKGSAPSLFLAALSIMLVQTWREYQRASYDELVAHITLEQTATRSARQDALTKLGNRRAFNERLATLQATRAPFALLLIDLDGFKSVNDTFGHSGGDAVLTSTAARIRRSLETGGAAFRLGGDEFAVLIACEGAEDLAARLVERCRQPTRHDGRSISVRISIGLARGPNARVQAMADEALYAAKGAGKDCWRTRTPLADAA